MMVPRFWINWQIGKWKYEYGKIISNPMPSKKKLSLRGDYVVACEYLNNTNQWAILFQSNTLEIPTPWHHHNYFCNLAFQTQTWDIFKESKNTEKAYPIYFFQVHSITVQSNKKNLKDYSRRKYVVGYAFVLENLIEKWLLVMPCAGFLGTKR